MLLLGHPMPDRWWPRQKGTPWLSRLGVGREANTAPQKILLRDLKRRPRPTQGCRADDDDDDDDDDDIYIYPITASTISCVLDGIIPVHFMPDKLRWFSKDLWNCWIYYTSAMVDVAHGLKCISHIRHFGSPFYFSSLYECRYGYSFIYIHTSIFF
jgi:hypothetical protein